MPPSVVMSSNFLQLNSGENNISQYDCALNLRVDEKCAKDFNLKNPHKKIENHHIILDIVFEKADKSAIKES